MKTSLIVLFLLFYQAFLEPGCCDNINKPNIVGPGGFMVNSYSGSLFLMRTDLYIPCRGFPLDLTFYYNSASTAIDMGYGPGWSMTYSLKCTSNGNTVTIRRSDGRKDLFTFNGSSYSPPEGIYELLENYEPGKFRLKTTKGTCYYFENPVHGRLTRITDPNSNAVSLAYTDSLPTTISDPSGRSLNLTYTGGHLTQVTDPNTSPPRHVAYAYDAAGNPVTITDPLNNVIHYTYDSGRNLVNYTDPRTNPVSITFEDCLRVSSIASSLNSISIAYNPALLTTTVTRTVGGQEQLTIYSYDVSGDLHEKTGNCCGYHEVYTYDLLHKLVQKTDANGNIATYAYDSVGNLLLETNPLGYLRKITYEHVFNNPDSITDRRGNLILNHYDVNGNLVQVDRPSGITEYYGHDAQGNTTSYTDGRGFITSCSCDIYGNITSVAYPDGTFNTFTYDGVGNLLSRTDGKWHTTLFTYDKLNRLVQTTDALSNSTSYTYDAAGNVTSVTDPLGHTVSFIYDALNRRTATITPAGTSYAAYDESGSLITRTDNNGNVTHFVYNGLNRLIKTINPMGENDSIAYDAGGRMTYYRFSSGNTIYFSYDAADRLGSTWDLAGSINSYSYDANSNLLAETDGNGNTTSYTYDALNRRVTRTDALSGSSITAYDNNSNAISRQDRNGHITHYSYNAMNRKTQTVFPSGKTNTIGYDAAGNIQSCTDDRGNTTTYTYNAVNRLLVITDANSATTTYSYDAKGNLLTRTDKNGSVTTYAYDPMDRLTGRDYPGTNDDSYSYDNGGRLLTANNLNAVISFTYDNADRILSENMNGHTTSSSFDTPGSKRLLTYPGGRNIEEYFDPRMRLVAIREGLSTLAAYSYDASNRITVKAYGNGTSTSYSYDNDNRVTSVSHTGGAAIAQFNYGFDPEGNILFSEKIHHPSNSEQYVYDADNRLVDYREGTLAAGIVSTPVTRTQFNYDGAGNRTSIIRDASTTTYSSNSVNEYTSISGAVVTTPAYDANGNTTGDGIHTYSYDFENHLIAVDGGSTATYAYDALGRRIKKITSGGTVSYYYDRHRIIEERDASNAVVATEVYGTWLDDLVNRRLGGADYFYHTNSLGSIAAVTGTSGIVAERYEYDAFGSPAIYTGGYSPVTGTAIGNATLFTGRTWDAEIGMYHYRTRYFNPSWGRFGQMDPIGMWGDKNNVGNGFAYVGNNPVNWIDPFGLLPGDVPPDDDPGWNSPPGFKPNEFFAGREQARADREANEQGFGPEQGFGNGPMVAGGGPPSSDKEIQEAYDSLIKDIQHDIDVIGKNCGPLWDTRIAWRKKLIGLLKKRDYKGYCDAVDEDCRLGRSMLLKELLKFGARILWKSIR